MSDYYWGRSQQLVLETLLVFTMQTRSYVRTLLLLTLLVELLVECLNYLSRSRSLSLSRERARAFCLSLSLSISLSHTLTHSPTAPEASSPRVRLVRRVR